MGRADPRNVARALSLSVTLVPYEDQSTRRIYFGGSYTDCFFLISSVDYELIRSSRWTPHLSLNTAYAINSKNKCTISAHRMIMGSPMGLEVDHINRNGLDCRRTNLRTATHTQNMLNSPSRTHSSVHRGVSWASRDKLWIAYINRSGNGKTTIVGYFKTEAEAALARVRAVLDEKKEVRDYYADNNNNRTNLR